MPLSFMTHTVMISFLYGGVRLNFWLLLSITQVFSGVAQCVPTWKIASSCMICTICIVVINSLYVLTLFSVLTVWVFGSFRRFGGFGGFGGWIVGWRCWLCLRCFHTGKRKRWQRCWSKSCHISCNSITPLSKICSHKYLCLNFN